MLTTEPKKNSKKLKIYNSYRKLNSVISVDTTLFIKEILGFHEQDVLGLENLLKHVVTQQKYL